MKGLLSAALAAGALITAVHAGDAASPAALASLSGTYVSAIEPWYGGYGTREFTFRDGTWHLIFTHALDPEMTLRTFQFRTGGPYEIGAPSAAVDGAYHGRFTEAFKHVTLVTQNPEVIAAMGMADCDLTPNLETDISEKGCANWKPVAECGVDHDLIKMEDGGIYFGVRPADNDMCSAEKTPTALLAPVRPR